MIFIRKIQIKFYYMKYGNSSISCAKIISLFIKFPRKIMAEIIPFSGILYNASKVSGEAVTAPPYDIITPEYKDQLYNKSLYNIVRIDFGKDLDKDNESENRYTRAAEYFNKWLNEKIMIKRESPGFYAYEITYTAHGKQKCLRGLFGLVKLEELGKGNIFPHECTHSKPKADRLNLMRACNANTSPIFSLYNSPEKKASTVIERTISSNAPYLEAKDTDGAVHRLWIIEDSNDMLAIADDLKGKSVFIADGHHRYETALEFQREMKEKYPNSNGNEPFNYVLMFLANISGGDITILPAHRLVRNLPQDPMPALSEFFDYEMLESGMRIDEKIALYEHAIGFLHGLSGRQYILKHRGAGLDDIHPALQGLDVTVLHELIFNKLFRVSDIEYEMDVDETAARVRNGLFEAAFFLNPTRVEDVERVALSLVRMPPKSTYFYPKLLTGFVINSFQN